MIQDLRVIVVMPAYNAEKTIEKTWREVVEQEVVDLVLVVDDANQDHTAEKARELDSVVVHRHEINQGYGANQKTCYRLALEHGADIVVMVHPDTSTHLNSFRRWLALLPAAFILACWPRASSAGRRWLVECHGGAISPIDG
jgi:glycosyltransferase involved in cell wall biosynthesis